MPTSVAASAPNMCEIAIRCGIAVIGTYTPSGIADRRADREAREDPVVAYDLVLHERADDREQHADGGELHAAAGRVGVREALQSQDEQDRRG